MYPYFKHQENNIEIFIRNSSHIPPHIHESIECILVTKGSLELGIGMELYHMEENDFAIVFPGLIHHYQVFDSNPCQAIYLLASPALSGGYLQSLENYCPEYPIIPSKNVHPDICYAMKRLLSDSSDTENRMIQQAFVQIILARSLPSYHMVSKDSIGNDDIVYQTVSYIAKHFTEKITLPEMAHNLGVSPYALSRVFSKVFHTNFNQYLNNARLEYACSLLEYSDQSITDVWCNAGFDSQRTFNRVFKERFHISPREFRAMRQKI